MNRGEKALENPFGYQGINNHRYKGQKVSMVKWAQLIVALFSAIIVSCVVVNVMIVISAKNDALSSISEFNVSTDELSDVVISDSSVRALEKVASISQDEEEKEAARLSISVIKKIMDSGKLGHVDASMSNDEAVYTVAFPFFLCDAFSYISHSSVESEKYVCESYAASSRSMMSDIAEYNTIVSGFSGLITLHSDKKLPEMTGENIE